ncbi:MAG: HlyC/CorC family transporter [Methylophilus methylotrophus]|uniref:HlyC/CorC family transporter n=1 Tax=Methylophilus methylotrophus TaxID=17 RepID=A0A5C7WJQ8_METME|nr:MULTISPECIES: HlyC/CorC family transporter [Methylophilus]PPD11207.1 MAG: magnesium and cobalt efflux protein CorC [Methylophilus sp.]TXI37580.1 MAG: HlyC/CorC family transporter [Methylophilus methylotrophus]
MDNIPISWQLVTLAVLLLLSGFFSIAETSLMSVNRYRLRHLMNEGHRGAKLASELLSQTDKLLGVILLCNNFANASAATLVTLITVELFGEGEWILMFGTLSVTFAILVFSEISPKVIAAAHPEKLALFSSYILYPLLRVLYPVVWFVNLFVSAILRLLRIKVSFKDQSHALTTEELRSIVSDAGQYIPSQNRTILLNLLDLEDIIVDDAMTAHTQVEFIDLDEPIDQIMEQLVRSHHSRLPVRQGDHEDIVGILHVRKVLPLLRDFHIGKAPTKALLQAAMSLPYYIPSGTPLYTQLQQFQKRHERIALIVDEYGEFKGLLTLEDILEEVVGEFTTQSPEHASHFHQLEDGSWLVDGSSLLRDLNRKLKLSLPTDGPRTLNGLILEHFEDIPEPNTSFKIDEHKLEILDAQDRVVKRVKIYP